MAPLLAQASDWIRMYVCVPTIDTELSLTHSCSHTPGYPHTHAEHLSKYPTIRDPETMPGLAHGRGKGGDSGGGSRIRGVLLFWLFRHLNSLQLMREFVLIFMLFSSKRLEGIYFSFRNKFKIGIWL